MKSAVAFLLWVGLVRRRRDGSIRWPIQFGPRLAFTSWRYLRATYRMAGPFYVFRNLPGVIKWEPGRLLPRRWGFGIMGLIEIGDRG